MKLYDVHYRHITTTIHSIEETKRRLTAKQSELDSEISRLYHIIEINDLSEIDIKQCFKELQDALRKRRVVKEEVRGIQSLSDNARKMLASIDASRKEIKQRKKRAEKEMNIKLSIYEVFN